MVSALETASGKLSTVIDKDDWSTVTSLSLTGTMDARDFKFMAESLTSLSDLDISGVSIEEYSDKQPLVANYTYFPAGEMPKYMLMGMPLKSVVLPSTLTVIGEGAFAGCGELTEIAIPSSVTTIGNYAFSNATKLATVTGGDGVATVGEYAFSHDKALAAMPQMQRLESIGGYAFLETKGLTSFSFPASLTTVGEGAFRMSGLTKADFSGCPDLDVIGAWAFADDAQMTELKLPEGLKSLGDGAFFYSTALQRVSLPEGLAKINDYAFMGGRAVSEASLPEGLTEIGDYALSDWSAITKLLIPASVEHIGGYAMRNWSSLEELTSESVTPPSLGESVWENVDYESVELKVPAAGEMAYRMAEQWQDFFKSSSAKPLDYNDLQIAVDGNVLTLTSATVIASAQLFDLSGIMLKAVAPRDHQAMIDLSAFGGQAYVVRCVLDGGKERIVKISRH